MSLHPGHVGTYSEEPDYIYLIDDDSEPEYVDLVEESDVEGIHLLGEKDGYLNETAEIIGAQFVSLETPAFATSTPKVKMSSDDNLYSLVDELKRLRKELDTQEKKMDEMTQSAFQTTRKDSPEKAPLPSKYDGSTDFCTYLVQFEVLAKQQRWSEEKQGVLLLSRLKGRALDVAAQGEDLSYPELVHRLKAHFSPEHEEMFAQKLQVLQKSSSQTWEDLAFEVRTLTRKAYRSANDSTKERLSIHAFVNAITDDGLRQKVRDAHPSTVQAALDRVRQVEADQAIEKQRRHHVDSAKGTAHTVFTDVNQQKIKNLESEVEDLRRKLEQRLSEKPATKENSEAERIPRLDAGRNFSRKNSRGRGSRIPRGNKSRCYFCDSPDHLLKHCPYKDTWRKKLRDSQSKGETLDSESRQLLNY